MTPHWRCSGYCTIVHLVYSPTSASTSLAHTYSIQNENPPSFLQWSTLIYSLMILFQILSLDYLLLLVWRHARQCRLPHLFLNLSLFSLTSFLFLFFLFPSSLFLLSLWRVWLWLWLTAQCSWRSSFKFQVVTIGNSKIASCYLKKKKN